MKKGKFKIISLFLLMVMIFNNLTVLADVVGSDKLEVTVEFDVRGKEGSLYNYGEKPGSTTFVVGANGEITQNNVLNNDGIIYKEPSKVFVIREKNDDEKDSDYKEYIKNTKESNSGREYFIDLTRVKAVWAGRIMNYDEYNSSGLKFKIDGNNFKNVPGKYKENIIINLEDKTLVRNEFYNDAKNEIYNKNNKNLISINGYYNGDKGNSLYKKDIRNNKIPRKTIRDNDLEEYLGKKYEPFYEEKSNHKFNLVGYSITSGDIYYWTSINDANITKIAESEYDLIKIIGMDRFVFLKNNKKFRGLTEKKYK